MNKLIVVVMLAVGAMAQVSAPQIALTGNIGAGGPGFSLLNSGTIVMSDANHTMTYPEMSAAFLKVTSSVPLTAIRDIITPVVRGFLFHIENLTTGGQSVRIIGASGTGIGQTVTVSFDGTNYVMAGFGNRTHTAFGPNGEAEVDISPPWPNYPTGASLFSPSTMLIAEQVDPSISAGWYSGLSVLKNFVHNLAGPIFAYGVLSNPTIDSASASTNRAVIIGLGGIVQDFSNAAAVNDITGVQASCSHEGASTIQFCFGADLGAFQGSGSGPITDAIGTRSAIQQADSGGHITNAYGNDLSSTVFDVGNFYQNYSALQVGITGNPTPGNVVNYYANYALYPRIITGSSVTNYYANYTEGFPGTPGIVSATNQYAWVSEPNSGNFGINTITPAQALDVVGIINASTGFQSGGTAGITASIPVSATCTLAVTGGLITGHSGAGCP